MTAAVLAGVGSALPDTVVTNHDLARTLDTSDEWIRTRTGIISRRRAGPGEATGDLAVRAARGALEHAARQDGTRQDGVTGVDLVILATTTPDHPCPATAPDVAVRLGLDGAAAFDLAAVCSGFVYGLAAAAGMLASGAARRALVIGAETYSTILDPHDRATAPIFGDGAGAVVLRAGTADEAGALLAFDLGSDGSGNDLIRVPGGGARERTAPPGEPVLSPHFTMQGQLVFKHAVQRMGESSRAVLDRTGWRTADVDRLVGHQANIRILHALADELDLDRDRAIVDLEHVGNTSAASIPLALDHAAADGRLKAGDRVLLTAFGGGLTWGSTTLVWPDLTTDGGHPARKEPS